MFIFEPIVLLFNQGDWPLAIIALVQSASRALLAFLILLAVAAIINSFRDIFALRGKKLSYRQENAVNITLAKRLPSEVLPLIQAAELVQSDLSIGAQVRGTINTRIVISGGLLVGLLKNDPGANGVIFHELAHIRHVDKLLTGFIALAIIELGSRIFYIYSHDATQGLVFDILAMLALLVPTFTSLIFVSFISKYREYYADAVALQQMKNKEAYIAMLGAAAEGPRSKLLFYFFHPSPKTRLRQATTGHPVLRRGLFWKGFWLAIIVDSYLEALMIDDADLRFSAMSYVVGGIVCLGLELLRWPILNLGDGVTRFVNSLFFNFLNRRGKYFPHFILVLGFVFLSFYASLYADLIGQTGLSKKNIVSVGSIIMFGIFLYYRRRRV